MDNGQLKIDNFLSDSAIMSWKSCIFARRNVKRYDYGSNNDNNDRPEEADFENNGVGFVSQVDD